MQSFSPGFTLYVHAGVLPKLYTYTPTPTHMAYNTRVLDFEAESMSLLSGLHFLFFPLSIFSCSINFKTPKRPCYNNACVHTFSPFPPSPRLFVDRVGWQATIASIECWIPLSNAHDLHSPPARVYDYAPLSKFDLSSVMIQANYEFYLLSENDYLGAR